MILCYTKSRGECLGFYIVSNLKIGDKALLLRTALLDKGVGDAKALSVIDKLRILSMRNGTVKRRYHTRHRRVLVHKADINAVAVGIV